MHRERPFRCKSRLHAPESGVEGVLLIMVGEALGARAVGCVVGVAGLTYGDVIAPTTDSPVQRS